MICGTSWCGQKDPFPFHCCRHRPHKPVQSRKGLMCTQYESLTCFSLGLSLLTCNNESQLHNHKNQNLLDAAEVDNSRCWLKKKIIHSIIKIFCFVKQGFVTENETSLLWSHILKDRQWWSNNLYGVSPCFRPMTAGRGSCRPPELWRKKSGLKAAIWLDYAGQKIVTFYSLHREERNLFSTFGQLPSEERQAAAAQCPGPCPDLHQCLWSRSLNGINPKMYFVWFRGNWSTVFCVQWLMRIVRNFWANFNFMNNRLFNVTSAEPQAAWWWIITTTTLTRPVKQCVSQVNVNLFHKTYWEEPSRKKEERKKLQEDG